MIVLRWIHPSSDMSLDTTCTAQGDPLIHIYPKHHQDHNTHQDSNTVCHRSPTPGQVMVADAAATGQTEAISCQSLAHDVRQAFDKASGLHRPKMACVQHEKFSLGQILWWGARCGWLWGMARGLVTLHWVANSLLIQPELFAWALPLALIGLPACVALFDAVVGATAAWIGWRWGNLLRPWAQIAVVALVISCVEQIKGWGPLAFPWNIMACMWTPWSVMLQPAAWVGSYGLGLMTLLLWVPLGTSMACLVGQASAVLFWRQRLWILTRGILGTLLLAGIWYQVSQMRINLCLGHLWAWHYSRTVRIDGCASATQDRKKSKTAGHVTPGQYYSREQRLPVDGGQIYALGAIAPAWVIKQTLPFFMPTRPHYVSPYQMASTLLAVPRAHPSRQDTDIQGTACGLFQRDLIGGIVPINQPLKQEKSYDVIRQNCRHNTMISGGHLRHSKVSGIKTHREQKSVFLGIKHHKLAWLDEGVEGRGYKDEGSVLKTSLRLQPLSYLDLDNDLDDITHPSHTDHQYEPHTEGKGNEKQAAGIMPIHTTSDNMWSLDRVNCSMFHEKPKEKMEESVWSFGRKQDNLWGKTCRLGCGSGWLLAEWWGGKKTVLSQQGGPSEAELVEKSQTVDSKLWHWYQWISKEMCRYFSNSSQPLPCYPGVRMRLVQPAFCMRQKMDVRYYPRHFGILMNLSAYPTTADQPITHVVWPEGAFPWSLTTHQLYAIPPLPPVPIATRHAKGMIVQPDDQSLAHWGHGPALIMCATYRDENGKVYNSILGRWNNSLSLNHWYSKRRLVPFGEKIPGRAFWQLFVPARWLRTVTPGGQGLDSGPDALGILVTPSGQKPSYSLDNSPRNLRLNKTCCPLKLNLHHSSSVVHHHAEVPYQDSFRPSTSTPDKALKFGGKARCTTICPLAQAPLAIVTSKNGKTVPCTETASCLWTSRSKQQSNGPLVVQSPYSTGKTPLAWGHLPPGRLLICYETLFARDILVPGQPQPQWILALTNDGWFGRSHGPEQHWTASQLRAIEYGIAVVRSAMSGISGVVDGLGRICACFPQGSGVLDVQVPIALPGQTLYARWGEGMWCLLVAGVLFSVFIAGRRKHKSTS